MTHIQKNKSDGGVKEKTANAPNSRNCDEIAEKSSGDVWQRDIENHDYYYDDSHGYEVYNPELDEENDEN